MSQLKRKIALVAALFIVLASCTVVLGFSLLNAPSSASYLLTALAYGAVWAFFAQPRFIQIFIALGFLQLIFHDIIRQICLPYVTDKLAERWLQYQFLMLSSMMMILWIGVLAWRRVEAGATSDTSAKELV